MKAPPLAYLRATSLQHAFELWDAAGPDAKLLAGGQSLIATLAFRLSDPGTLIDISRVPELRGIEQTASTIRIGALTTHAELGGSALIQQHAPLLAAAVPLIAHPAIRNRGTIGGSLAFADPAAELPACCVALDAVVVARSASGERRIPAREFFTGLFSTALDSGELISAVEVPVATPADRTAIIELARRSGDYAMAGLAARAAMDGPALATLSLVYFGVGDGPVVAHKAAAALTGEAPTAERIDAARAALDEDLDPPPDQHGSPAMKRHLAGVLLARVLHRLTGHEEARAA